MMNLFPPPPATAAKPSRIWKVLPAPVHVVLGGWIEGAYRLPCWSEEASDEVETTLLDVLRRDVTPRLVDLSYGDVYEMDIFAPDGRLWRVRIEVQLYESGEPARN